MLSFSFIQRFLRGFFAIVVMTLSALMPLKQLHAPLSSVLFQSIQTDGQNESAADDYSSSSEEEASDEFGLNHLLSASLNWRKVVAPSNREVFISRAGEGIFRIRAPGLLFKRLSTVRPGYYLFLFRYSLF